ncbi:MAG: DRTGG domain-containing protein, partial [Chthoniobacterales bacterium]|nr:DRTGG domain-containing protein [Chthoniobacterales bacterium]
PVVDSEGRCVGLLSGFRITRYLFPPATERSRAREVTASLADIVSTFGGTCIAGHLDTEIRHRTLMVAAMNPETFAERVSKMDDPEQTVLFVGDRSDIIGLAIGLGISAIVLTGGLHMPPDMIEAARAAGVVLIESPLDTATSVLLSRSAMQARLLLDDSFHPLTPETTIEAARAEVALSNDFAFPVVDSNGVLVGILSKSDFLKPVPRQLILVDHNELGQAVNGAEHIPIVEILDHHRISTIITDSPILFINRPVGSTSTIIAMCYEQASVAIPKPIAGILMCGIISDTLNLTSPTTTDTDRYIMKLLESITGQNPTDLANEIFSVGSPLLTMSAEAAITADMKPYEEHGKRFSIAQIEELTFSHFWEKADQLLEKLEDFRHTNQFFFSALLVTDVNSQNSLLLLRGPNSFTKLIDYPEIQKNLWRLDGVVSRKKQLLPYLCSLLSKITAN